MSSCSTLAGPRGHLQAVTPALNDHQIGELASTALEIYNRCENRRRMGFEVTVLSFLINSRSAWLEIPEKYHSKAFVMDMLVSCRFG